MASMDVFNSNAFSMTSLTAAIETGPYKPRLLGELGIFEQVPIRTTTAWVEKKNGKLAILNTTSRGAINNVRSPVTRTGVNLRIPHVPYFQSVLADDVQNIRAFGSETELMGVAEYVNDQLIAMKNDHEVTHEFHRIGALKGIVYDGDNSTVIYNLQTEFGLNVQTQNWAAADASFAPTVTAAIRKIADKLGNESFSRVVCLCGNSHFDGIVKHASMSAAYDRWRDGEFLRMSHIGPAWYAAATAGFQYQNVLFINYRGTIGDVTFIPDTEAYYFPVGVPGLFREVIAPADFMETVNTKGRKYYAKMEPLPFDKGMQLHTQSNVLAICTRPDCVVKSTYTP